MAIRTSDGTTSRRVTRRVFLGGGIALAAGLISARIVQVNADAFYYPVVHHVCGETFDLTGTFLSGASYEPHNGLSVKYSGAETLSYNEWIEQYATDYPRSVKGFDAKNIVNLSVTFSSTGVEDAPAYYIVESQLIPARKNTYFVFDAELFGRTDFAGGSGLQMLTFASGKGSVNMQLPYVLNNFNPGYPRYLTPMTDRNFEWVVSNGPERHVFDVSI